MNLIKFTLIAGLSTLPTMLFATVGAAPPPVADNSNNDALALAIGLFIVGFALFGNTVGSSIGGKTKKNARPAESEDAKNVIGKF